jgi:hypothetical protein
MKSIICAFVCLSCLFAPIGANCCTCRAVEFDEQIEAANLAFVGKVISRVIRRSVGSDLSFVGGEIAVHTLVVSRWFKGQRTSDTIRIESSASGASCGKHMTVDSIYIVYAYFKLDYSDRDNPIVTDTLTTNLCTRTRLASDEDEMVLLERYAAEVKK